MEPGSWLVMALPPDFVRRGRVVVDLGPSMIVRWLGDDHDTVLPWAGEQIREGVLRPVEPPASALAAPSVAKSGSLTQAAAMLGITAKRARQLLRSGKISGTKEAGSWIEVDLRSVTAYLKSRGGQATD